MSGKKSAEKSAPGVPFQPGADPRRGRGPKKGAPNAGRPTDEFKQAMQRLAGRPAAIKRLEKILSGARTVSDSDFLHAHKHVTERGFGKVPTVIEGGDERKPLVIRLVRERKA